MVGSLSRLCAIVGCVASLIAALPSSAFGRGPYNHLESAFCETSTVRGNPAELKRLPALREAPVSGKLPFAPKTMEFKSYDNFQVGDGRIGFTLRQFDGRRTDPLGFTVEATFLRIDRRGRAVEMLGRMYTPVASIKGYETVSFSFDVERPGLYRANVSFSDETGDELGRYGTYTRLLPLVVRPPRLALNAKTFVPGDWVMARVENFSKDSISYGVPYSIQRWDGTAWSKAPESPRGPWIMPLYISRPGSTGPCLAFRIPKTTPPGTYRFVKPLRASQGPLRSTFEVLPAS